MTTQTFKLHALLRDFAATHSAKVGPGAVTGQPDFMPGQLVVLGAGAYENCGIGAAVVTTRPFNAAEVIAAFIKEARPEERAEARDADRDLALGQDDLEDFALYLQDRGLAVRVAAREWNLSVDQIQDHDVHGEG